MESAWQDVLEAVKNGKLEGKPSHLSVTQSVTKRVFEAETQDIKDEAMHLREKWNKAVDDGQEPDIEELVNDDDADGAEEEEEDDEAREERERIAVLKSYRV